VKEHGIVLFKAVVKILEKDPEAAKEPYFLRVEKNPEFFIDMLEQCPSSDKSSSPPKL